MKRSWVPGVALLTLLSLTVDAAEEKVFSGPQVGEKLVPFVAGGVYDEAAGNRLDFVTEAKGRPLLLIFVHDPLTRPSAAVTRALSEYAARHKEKLAAGIVFLKDDRSAAEQYLQRARGSLRLKTPVAVSLDGIEGPGAYGLNRNVSLTILVGKENTVTANFALIQPSTTDGPRIAAEIAKVIGENPPTQEEFDRLAYGNRQYAGIGGKRDAVEIPRELLAPVINKQATPEKVKEAVEKVEEYIAGNKARQAALGAVAARVVGSEKFENYGTPAAREQLKQWAKTYGPKENER